MAFLDLFRRRGLTAAASIADTDRTLDKTSVMAREVGDAWQVWRQVGEIHYSTTQQARVISRVRWDLALSGNSLDSDDAETMMKAAFGKRYRDLVRQASLHLQVAGSYYLMRVDDRWRVEGNPLDWKTKDLAKRADVLVLVENPDPREVGRMDSPVLAAMDVARELLLARAQSRAASRSRTAQLNTVLYPLEGAGPDPTAFEKKLANMMQAPLVNEMSVSSVVPNIIGFNGEYIDKWKTLDLSGPVEEKLYERIDRLIKQVATILDSPVELLTGMGDTNHWTAWLVQEDNWRSHAEPQAHLIGEGFALAFAQATGVDPEAVDITPDPAPLLERRPALADVATAHQQGVVNDEFYRAALGADDEDAPTPEELARREPAAINAPEAVQEPEQPVAAAAPTAALVERLRPILAAPEPSLPDGRTLAAIDTQAYDALEDLLTDTVERVLTRLGAKVRTIAQGKDIGVDGAERMDNAALAVAYTGEIPNLDDTISMTIEAEVSKMDRIVTRAYGRARDAGVPITLPEDILHDARDTFRSLTATLVYNALDDRPLDAATWTASRRIVSVAGGGGDPKPAVAAPGIATVALGIALGRNAVEAVLNTYAAVPGGYTWFHQAGPTQHPKHVALDGRAFNGQYILDDGVNWFPGDHAGCRCIAVPEFQRVGS